MTKATTSFPKKHLLEFEEGMQVILDEIQKSTWSEWGTGAYFHSLNTSPEEKETYIKFLKTKFTCIPVEVLQNAGNDGSWPICHDAPLEKAPRHMHLIAKIKVEVNKLGKSSFLGEVQYLVWLGNFSKLRKRTSGSGYASTFWTWIKPVPKMTLSLLHMELLIDATAINHYPLWMDRRATIK